MGVLGLWQLLSPVGQPVTLESLENKIFAVDISIWLNQAVKGYRDAQGGSVHNAHLLSLFSRLCKLLFYKIRPVIVFDGGFPELKKQTIIKRQKRRAAAKQNTRDIGLKLLTNYLASQQLGQPTSSSKVVLKEKPRDEIFKLPPLPETSVSNDSCEEEDEEKFTNFSREDIRYLNQIDIESEDFNSLPPDVKQEILSTLKESRRHRTWDQYEELPKDSNDFSNFQMQCLLKKRKLQSKLEEVQKDLRRINSSAYVSQYTNDHVIGETNKIMSDDVSYYVLLKKIMEKTDSDSNMKPGTSVMADTKSAFIRDIENIDVDDDHSSEKEFSLVSTQIKSENDEDVDNPPAMNLSEDKMEQNDLKFADMEAKSDENDEDFDVDNPPAMNLSADKIEQNLENDLKFADMGAKSDENVDPSPKYVLCQETGTHLESNTHKSDTSTDSEKLKSHVHNITVEPLSAHSDVEHHLESDSHKMEPNVESEKFKEKSTPNCNPEKTVSQSDFSTENSNLSSPVDIREKSIGQGNDSKPVIDVSPLPMNDQDTHKSNQDPEIPETFSSSTHSPDSQPFSDEDTREANNTELRENLDAAAAVLEAERAKRERQARSVQDHMIEECQELLRLFGVPYVVSPLEAEAQCAFYDSVEFTHGTITDDSDVWLFGGRRVLKNFFSQQKYVESYKDSEIFHHFGLSRNKLINFALLTGSDYTEGIEGVGPVTAMEIISEFPGDDLEALQRFKAWWEDSQQHARPPENKTRAKFLKLALTENFPDEKVFDAYLNPEVDDSTEKFTWGRPDLDAIREYARERFGWGQSKVDDALLPVLKKLTERDRQTHLDSFFTLTRLKKQTDLFPSKRITTALKKITKLESRESRESVKRKSNASGSRGKKSRASVRGRNVKSCGPQLSESSDSDS